MATVQLHKTSEKPDAEENEDVSFAKALAVKSAVSTIIYPLTFAKTLFQLGYEPYPLSTGKIFVAFGREAYFLPNAAVYLRNVYRDHGLATIYRGWEAALASSVVGGIVAHSVENYVNEYFPEIGGSVDLIGKKSVELSDYDSFRLYLRSGIRQTFAHSAGIIVSRPFAVLMVREIAQHIGGEFKYPDVIRGLLRVGDEEGPAGLFSGLLPALVADYVIVWGVSVLQYSVERLLLKAEKNYKDDEGATNTIRDVRRYAPHVIPFVVSGWSYSFAVCSTVMSVVGSQLVVSMLPYAPAHSHWTDAYHYLKPHGLTRGARMLFREQKGAVSVGSDQQLYASNKFYI